MNKFYAVDLTDNRRNRTKCIRHGDLVSDICTPPL